MSDHPTEETLSMWSHLEELRHVIIRAGVAIVVATLASFAWARLLFDTLTLPYRRLMTAEGVSAVLQTLEPSETFKMSIQLALIAGILLTSPYWVWLIWRFIAPALTTRERKMIVPMLSAGVGLFVVGAVFAYWAVLPIMLRFFWDYSMGLGIQPLWTVSEYLNFVISNLVCFGIAFELPVVVALLTALGIVSAAMLVKGRRMAIMVIFIVAALLTPPDVVSQLLMAVPMLGLFELSIWVSRVIERKTSSEDSYT